MTIEHAGLQELVFGSIRELNKELPKGQKLEQTLETVVGGRDANLDSIAIVSFQMILTDKLTEQLISVAPPDIESFFDTEQDALKVADLIAFLDDALR